MSAINDAATGYGTYWIDLAEAFASGRLEEFSIKCQNKKDAIDIRFEYYSFRADAKATYPELVVLKARIEENDDGTACLIFTSRDRSKSSLALRSALIEHGILNVDGSPKV